MRYSDEFVEEVRSRNDVVDVVSAYVTLKRSGSNYFGLCPFHNEKSPSFSVSPNKQMFYCFGCHKGGTVFTFVQEYENVSFPEAVTMLAEKAGMQVPQQDQSEESRRRQNLKEQLLQVNRDAAAYYFSVLRSPAGAVGMKYLQGRALSPETMQRFGLGYAGQNGGLYRHLKGKGYSDELMVQAGLVAVDERRGAYDKFWNRVMFPIADANNRVIGFGGRVMGDAKPKYLNSPENELFNKRRNLYALQIARRSRESNLILCEGYMDVISMHQAGFTNAVASLGTALTEEHAALLRRYTKEVILSYDSDSAGVNAALRAIPMLKAEGLRVRILHLNPYKDPDEFIKAEGQEALAQRIKEAQGSYFFEVDVLRSQYSMTDPEERTQFQRAVAAKIAQMETEAERENYMQASAAQYMIPIDALRQLVTIALAKGVVPERYIPKENQAGKGKDRKDGILTSERRLLTWLTEYPNLYQVVKTYVRPEDFASDLYRETARMLYAQLEEGQLNAAGIIDHFEDEEDQKAAAELFHTNADTRSPEELQKAMRETIQKVSEEAMKRRSAGGQVTDWNEVIEAKKRTEQLKKLHIDLSRQSE